jgi:hypothetical protein
MQTRSPRWSLSLPVLPLLAGLVGMLAVASPARADAADPEAARVSAVGHSAKWNWTPPGRSARFGHAETIVHASEATVRQQVLDFGKYRELASSITTSRVVGHEPDGAVDVYLQMGVLNNTFHLWDVTRFAPPRVADGNEIIEGTKVPGKGNIDDAVLVWTLRAAGPDWTVLKFDLLLNPGLPAPQSLIDEQLRDSALDAVNAIHDRAQGSKDFVAYTP